MNEADEKQSQVAEHSEQLRAPPSLDFGVDSCNPWQNQEQALGGELDQQFQEAEPHHHYHNPSYPHYSACPSPAPAPPLAPVPGHAHAVLNQCLHPWRGWDQWELRNPLKKPKGKSLGAKVKHIWHSMK